MRPPSAGPPGGGVSLETGLSGTTGTHGSVTTTARGMRDTTKNSSLLHSKRSILVLAVVAVLAFAACTGGDDSSPALRVPAEDQEFDDGAQSNFDASGERRASSATAAPTATAASPPGASPAAPQPDTLGSGAVELAAPQTVNFGRDSIFRADLTVAVADVAAAGSEATNVIDSLGGFLFGQQTTGGASPQSVLIFKVLPENFQNALDALGSIGEIRSQNVSADDVTERVVDLESRITTALASVNRLRGFLENATDISKIAELERELLNRETTLETMRGQLRTLEGQVSLATITLLLTEDDIRPAMSLGVNTYLGDEDSGQSCPGDDEPSFLEGDTVTVCYEIFNEGDTSLTGFTLRDSVLDVEFEDVIVVRGDPSLLEPGQSLVLASSIVVERDLRTQTRVTAGPVNEGTGAVVTGRTVAHTESMFIQVRDPGGLPGFGDALSTSWDALQNLGGIVVLAAGGILPFIWVPVLGAVYVGWRRRRNEDESTKAEVAG